MKSIAQNKLEARMKLRGNWTPAVIATLLYFVIVFLCSSPNFIYIFSHPNYAQDLAYAAQTNDINKLVGIYGGLSRMSSISSLLMILIGNVLVVGFMNAFLKFYKSGDRGMARNTIAFSLSNYGHKLLGMFLMGLFIALWSLLLVIPGIIKAFSYAMTPYILHEYPTVGVNDAIDISRKMMKGHKLDMFILELSFIGWGLLCMLSCGIGFLWLIPYMQTSLSIFYEDVKAEYIEKYGEMTLR